MARSRENFTFTFYRVCALENGTNPFFICDISSFLRGVVEAFAFLGCYAAQVGNSWTA